MLRRKLDSEWQKVDERKTSYQIENYGRVGAMTICKKEKKEWKIGCQFVQVIEVDTKDHNAVKWWQEKTLGWYWNISLAKNTVNGI